MLHPCSCVMLFCFGVFESAVLLLPPHQCCVRVLHFDVAFLFADAAAVCLAGSCLPPATAVGLWGVWRCLRRRQGSFAPMLTNTGYSSFDVVFGPFLTMFGNLTARACGVLYQAHACHDAEWCLQSDVLPDSRLFRSRPWKNAQLIEYQSIRTTVTAPGPAEAESYISAYGYRVDALGSPIQFGNQFHAHDGPNNTFAAIRIINSTASPAVDLLYAEFFDVNDPDAYVRLPPRHLPSPLSISFLLPPP